MINYLLSLNLNPVLNQKQVRNVNQNSSISCIIITFSELQNFIISEKICNFVFFNFWISDCRNSFVVITFLRDIDDTAGYDRLLHSGRLALDSPCPPSSCQSPEDCLGSWNVRNVPMRETESTVLYHI